MTFNPANKEQLLALDENGRTPLHRAAMQGDFKRLMEYIQQGAPLNLFDFYGKSPLELAGDNKIKQYLLDNGASPLQPTELHDALFPGNVIEITALLDKNPSFLNELDDNGQTALHLAVLDGSLDIVEVLLENEAELTILDRSGYPPLYYALTDPEIKRCLIEHGAIDVDPSVCPIDLSHTELHQAAIDNDLNAIKKILGQNKEIIDYARRDAYSPLDLALFYGNVSAATLLITEGADINRLNRTFQYQSPLHRAVLAGELELVKTLVDHGAIIDAQDVSCRTPLHLAAEMNHLDIACFLLENQADPELTDYLQQNIIDKSKKETQESAIKKHTDLSKMFKRKIGLDNLYLEKISLAFEQMLKKQMSSKTSDKKILVLLGELHGSYKIQQLKKKLLKGMHAAGVSYLCVESPQNISAYDLGNIARIAKDNYFMTIKPVDLHPERENVSVVERNKVIRDEIIALNQDAVFITGIGHLYSLLEDSDANIPTSQFHVIPINLSSIIPNKYSDSLEVMFAYDSAKVIQLFTNNEDYFTDIQPVIEHWNDNSLKLDASQNNQEEASPKLPKQTISIAEVLLAINHQNTKCQKQGMLLQLIKENQFSLEEFNLLYDELKKIDGLNTHRNPHLDRFFGIKHTHSWQQTLKQLRNAALERLFQEMEAKETKLEKLELLKQAKTRPLFQEHRSNSIFTGAWGRTTAVKNIEAEELKLTVNKVPY